MKLTDARATLIVGLIAALVAVLTYAWTEWSKLAYEDYVRRELRYQKLVSSAEGFRVHRENTEQKRLFLRELDQCWLYCPDDVIRAAYDFLDSVKVGSGTTAKERAAAFGQFMLAIRQDLISRDRVTDTALKPSDYALLKAVDK